MPVSGLKKKVTKLEAEAMDRERASRSQQQGEDQEKVEGRTLGSAKEGAVLILVLPNTLFSVTEPKFTKVVQVDLHNAKGASAVIARLFVKRHLRISLIQEPWIDTAGQITGLSCENSKEIYDHRQVTEMGI